MGALKQLNEQRGAGGRQGSSARVEAIINSMTTGERRNHAHHQRQPPQADREGQRHAVEDVNRVLKQFVEMRKMLKTMGGMAGGGS